MANKPGVVWGSSRSPDDLRAQVSITQQALNGDEVGEILNGFLKDGADFMERAISTRGVRNGIPNTDGRVKSGAMLGSVSWELNRSARGRTRGRFGYLNSPPKWTLWQEYGTDGGQGNGQGIKALQALTDAYTQFEQAIEHEFEGRVVHMLQGKFKG